MPNNIEAWSKRAKDVIEQHKERRGAEITPFATSLLTAMYGPQSPQLAAFSATLAQIAKQSESGRMAIFNQAQHASSVVSNVLAEMDAGLLSSVRAQVAGEVISELVGLGKEILGDNAESAKNVSAVLIAAAFEDLIRRMGSELAGVVGRPKLDAVITELKTAGVLKGGEPGVAQSYLKFRNDSLHADWANVERPQIQACIGFIEGLLAKHFS